MLDPLFGGEEGVWQTNPQKDPKKFSKTVSPSPKRA